MFIKRKNLEHPAHETFPDETFPHETFPDAH
jgi:hypothetical protein